MTTLPPCLAAGLLLAAIPVLNGLALLAPAAAAVLEATGAGRTTAYKVKGEIEAVLPNLLRPPGRPPAPEAPAAQDLTPLHHAVRDFLFDHPGAVTGTATRRGYSDRFRLFVLELWEKNRDLSPEALARVVGVPLPTLKDWLRGERPLVGPPESLATVPTPAPARIQAVLNAWDHWADKKRGFRAFCQHVWFHLRVPFGRRHIRDILAAHGVRIPGKRGRPPDASALREGFATFFPGAQWVGDGTELSVELNGERFTFNLELLVDADTCAFTGASIRPTEDAAAVTEALADGIETTGKAPLALLLDNKPSNHGEAVERALGDETLGIRSRPYVPTDKPQVEGAFGLFAQEAPALVLSGRTLAELAAGVLRLVVTTWGRAVNHRPRKDREGKSRAQLYDNAAPTPEEIEAARAALRERQRKQERARQTRQRRQDPVARARLDAAFTRLGLEDEGGHLRAAIASWPLDAVIDGIAIFEGKKNAGTLPEGADGRYLRGIVKNLAQEAEGMAIAEALLVERSAARDEALAHLGRQQDAIEDEDEDADPEDLVKVFVDKALATGRGIDRTFWLRATADIIQGEEPADHRHMLRLAARRIHATHRVPHKERLAAARFLFAKVLQVA